MFWFSIRTLVVAGFLVTPLLSAAQRVSPPSTDYLVTLSGDTLRGTIQLPTDYAHEGISLKADKKGAGRSFTPEMLRGFGLRTGERYQKRLLPTGRNTGSGQSDSTEVLMQQLIVGYASLYRLEEDPSRHSGERFRPDPVQYYLSSSSSRLMLVRKPYQTTLPAMLPGCNQVVVPEGNLAEQELGNLVLRYDSLCHPSNPVHDYRLPVKPSTLRITVGMRLSGQTGKLYFDKTHHNLREELVQNYTLPAYALEMSLIYDGPWSLMTGVEYAKHRGKHTMSRPAQAGTSNANEMLTSTSSVSAQTLVVPLVVRYTLGRKQLRPYIAAGILLGKYLNKETALPYTYFTNVGENGNTVFREDVVQISSPPRSEADNLIGTTLRTGLQLSISPRIKPTLEVNYSTGRGFYTNPGIVYQNVEVVKDLGRLHFKTIGFSAGLAF